jgi:hypothetical protein
MEGQEMKKLSRRQRKALADAYTLCSAGLHSSRAVPAMTRAQQKLLRWFDDQYGPVHWHDGASGSKPVREALQRDGLIRQIYSRRGDDFLLAITDAGRSALR